MKLIKIILLVLLTFTACFLASWALDINWVMNQPARQILVYFMMLMIAGVGYLTLKEILRNDL